MHARLSGRVPPTSGLFLEVAGTHSKPMVESEERGPVRDTSSFFGGNTSPIHPPRVDIQTSACKARSLSVKPKGKHFHISPKF